METPLLSICLITYNHGAYIEQAIEGVLKQQVNFSWELVIADDCSKDNTRDLIMKYKEKYPDQIKLIFQEKNVGPARNWLDLIGYPKSKYIAYFEGDDYWTDKNKLQKQVDFLEANSNYTLCFHDVLVQRKKRKTRGFHWDAPDTSDIRYLLTKGNYISSLSVVFRNDPELIVFLRQFVDMPFGDYILYIGAARNGGLLKFFPERMGVYRVHGGGAWSLVSMPMAIERKIKVLRSLYLALPENLREYIKIQYLSTLEDLFRFHGFSNSKIDRTRLDIPEMKIEPYIIEYIEQSVQDKVKPGFYVKYVPMNILVKSVIQKPLNRLSL